MVTMEINFLVQGSAKDPYEVTFIKDGDNLAALCTCPAGKMGQYCKHRINILGGSIKNVVSENVDDVKVVESWLPGTDVETALIEVLAAEKEFKAAKQNLMNYKKKLARVMHD